MNLHLKIQYVVGSFLKKGINPHFGPTGNKLLESPESLINREIIMIMAASLKINIMKTSGTERPQRPQSHFHCQSCATASTCRNFLSLHRRHCLFLAHEAEIQSSSPSRTLVRSARQAQVCCEPNGALALRYAGSFLLDLLQRSEKKGQVDSNS